MWGQIIVNILPTEKLSETLPAAPYTFGLRASLGCLLPLTGGEDWLLAVSTPFSLTDTFNENESASCLEQSHLPQGHNSTGGAAPEEAQSRNPGTFSLQLCTATLLCKLPTTQQPPLLYTLLTKVLVISKDWNLDIIYSNQYIHKHENMNEYNYFTPETNFPFLELWKGAVAED